MVKNIIQFKSGIKIRVNVSVKIYLNIVYAKKYYLLNRSACPCQKNEYLGSIIDDSVVTCDETTKPTKTIFKILMIKKQPAK